MRNAKKTLSLVMIAIFTTFIVLSGIPAGAVTTAAAKAQVTKATAAVVKVEKTVKVSNFNPTTATTQLTAANKEVAKVKSLGKTYAKTYTALNTRATAVAKKIAARKAAIAAQVKALAMAFANADKAVTAAENAVDGDKVDLVADEAALANAQGAVTAALEMVVKLDPNSTNYKGLMARIDAANALIVKAMDEVAAVKAEEEAAAAAKAAEEAAAKAAAEALTAAETAVKAVEDAVAAGKLTEAVDLAKVAVEKVALVKDAEKVAGFNARLLALVPAKATTATAVDGTITVNFDKKVGTTPAAAAFVVMKAVGTTTPVAVTPTAVAAVSETAVALTVPAVAADVAEQSVVYTVAYNGAAAITAAAFKVPAATVAVEAIDVNKVKVTFPAAVDTAKVKVALKQGVATQYTTCAFAEDKKSATLTAPSAIAAGDYTVEVTGLVSAAVTAPITIVAAAAKAIEITSTQLTIGAGSVATFVVKNQYGTDMGVFGAAGITVNAFDITTGTVVNPTNYSATKSEFSLDLSVTSTPTLKVGDDIRVIVSYKGLTTSKTVKVVAVASAAQITLGAVAPLTGKTRITVNETGLVLPYTVKDQYGNDVYLNAAGVTVVSSNNAIVNPATIAVDANGKATFTAGGTAGTVTLTAIINATGAVATTTFTVENAAALKSVTVAAPTALIAAGESVSLALTGVDQFGAATTNFGAINTVSSDNAAVTASIVNGKLKVVTTAAGTAVITLKNVSGTPAVTTTYGTITIKVENAAVPTAITGITAPVTFEVGATYDMAWTKLTAVDQYGRAYTLTNGQVTTAKVDTANTVFTVGTADPSKVVFTAGADAGTTAVKFTLVGNSATFTANFVAVATSSITSYTATVDADVLAQSKVPAGWTAADYVAPITLTGKLADGTSVVLVAGKVANSTSSNNLVATVAGTNVTGVAAGTSVVALWSASGAKLAEVTVTVKEATPVATTVTIDDSTAFTATKDGVTKANVGAKLEVLDQYGVDITAHVVGFWASSDTTVATVDANGLVTGKAAGTVTITYVTPNGIVKTTTVTVE